MNYKYFGKLNTLYTQMHNYQYYIRENKTIRNVAIKINGSYIPFCPGTPFYTGFSSIKIVMNDFLKSYINYFRKCFIIYSLVIYLF